MSKRGENIYKRKDGRWESRFKIKADSNKYKYLYAQTYKESKNKPYELKSTNQLLSNKKRAL